MTIIKSRVPRIIIAVAMLLAGLGMLAAALACWRAEAYLGAVLCLPTAAGFGWMFVRDVRALIG